ncbi:hypothetical protein MHOL44478_07945 [Mycobacterium holsaticum DSM 44478]|nr:hypothetical protein [Mycolicibacterium holsaticum DSM 44478 = JCM 12374]
MSRRPARTRRSQCRNGSRSSRVPTRRSAPRSGCSRSRWDQQPEASAWARQVRRRWRFAARRRVRRVPPA